MIKKIVALFIFCSAVQGTFAQQHAPDSLKKQLLSAKHDTSKVLILAKLVAYYAFNTPDSAFKYGSKGLKLAQESHYPKGEVVMLNRLGFLYRETGNLPKALDLALRSLSILQKSYYLEEQQQTFILFGTIYHDLGDYQKSNSYNLQSKAIAEKLDNQIGIDGALLNVASNYIELGNTDSADYYINKAYAGFVKLNATNNNTYLWRNMGRLQFILGNYDRALADLKKALMISLNRQDHRNAAYNYAQLAEVFEKTNKTDSVIFYSKLGLQEGKTGPFNLFILKSCVKLVNAFKNKHDFKSALFYNELLQNTKESLFGAGNIQAINKLITDENERKKEVEDQKIAYKNQVKQYILLVGVAIILLIASTLYRNYKKQQKANKLLHQQKEEINAALLQLKTTQTQLIQSEKMASLGELTAGIAHEIQNPLNFVNNFSEVNTELIDEMQVEIDKGDFEEVKAIANDIKENQQKINQHGKRADFIVKGMLQHSRASAGERQPTNINTLADEFLKLSYHGLRAKDKTFNAELATNFDDKLPTLNVVQQDIGRVLLNLFNNAFYAVGQKQKKADKDYKAEVSVTTLSSNGQVIIKVKDNGMGIPDSIKDKIMQPFFTTKPTGEGTGLGLSLSYDIVVNGHGGKLEVKSEEGKCTEFIISLPV